MLEYLETLCELDGVSGREEAVRNFILKEAVDHADEVRIGATGSVTMFKRGYGRSKATLMLCANMDERGFYITGITDDGMLRFEPVGDIDARTLCGSALRIGAAGISGVIGTVPVHLTKKSELSKVQKTESMLIDIGASDRAQALSAVRPGDFAVFDTGFELMGGGLVKGKAFESRAGCAVLMELLTRDCEYDTFFSFATLGTQGNIGAGCEAFGIEPDAAVCLGAAHAADIPGVDKEERMTCVGGGAAVGLMTGNTVFDTGLFDMTLAAGEEAGIAVQIRSGRNGGSGAGAVQTSRGGVRTLCVDLPVRYLDGPVQLASLSDIDAVLELTQELAVRICE